MIVHDLDEPRAILDAARAEGKSIGFVPTMGSLHDGHRSLLQRSVASCDVSVMSVFVNPLQFGPGEDLAAYPGSLDADAAMAAAEGVDLVVAPSVETMYPEPILTLVRVNELSDGLESETRPAHFDGVTTVVAKLFNVIGPCHAFFGEKDFQQLALVRRMVSDLSMPITVVGCPIVREPDGLAMSSRNAYLSEPEREAATVLSRAVRAGAEAIAAGEPSSEAVESSMAAVVWSEPLAELDYVAVRDPASLLPVDTVDAPVRVLVAARVGTTRLIDNGAAEPPGSNSDGVVGSED